jgi:hypothetical protein
LITSGFHPFSEYHQVLVFFALPEPTAAGKTILTSNKFKYKGSQSFIEAFEFQLHKFYRDDFFFEDSIAKAMLHRKKHQKGLGES